MDNYSKKFFLSFMSLMCMLLLFCNASIISKAADTLPNGTLIEGINFNTTVKKLANSKNKEYFDADYLIKNIYFNKPHASGLKSASVGVGVTAYFEETTGNLYIDGPQKIKFNQNSRCVFANLNNLESIDFGNNIDTSSAQELNYLFKNDAKLKSINLISFRTQNCEEMQGMFEGCSGLESLDLGSFNTSKCEDFKYLFDGCTNLKSINFSSFSTVSAKYMNRTFANCTSLTSIDLRNFNTANVKDMTGLFAECSGLKQVDLSSFNTENLSDMSFMFYGCSSLETIDLRSFKLPEIDYDHQREAVFNCCDSLKTIYSPSYIVKDFTYDYISEKFQKDGYPIRLLGQLAVDDDNNGIPDHGTFYSKLPKSDKSHKYLVVSKLANPTVVDGKDPIQIEAEKANLQRIHTVNGITYQLDNDSNATVIKISDIKKASLNKVTINNVTFPVVAIADNACKGNKKLAKLTIGPNVKSIGKNAFKGCKKLKKITINPNKSLKINKGAFKKLHKKATIRIKTKNRLLKNKIAKALVKQTNATVK